MALIPARLRRNRTFLAGLGLRLAAVLLLVPQLQDRWFIPFLIGTVRAPSIDPWTIFLLHGGSPLAFLYGPVMVLYELPFVALGLLVDTGLGTGLMATRVAPGFAILLADYGMLRLLQWLVGDDDPDAADRTVVLYWLSPLVLFINYWNGQTDVIPALAVVGSLLLLRAQSPRWAGCVLGLGILAKISTAAVLPFLLIFLWSHRRHRDTMKGFLLTCIVVAAVQLPLLLWSGGLHEMLAAGGELHRVLDLAVPFGGAERIFVMPVAYLLLLYGTWQVGRMNFELLYATLGAAYFLVLLLTPNSGGWYMMTVPFLVIYQLRAGQRGRALSLAFAGVFVLHELLTTTPPAISLSGLNNGRQLLPSFGISNALISSLVLSALTALGLVLALTMLRRGLGQNDFFGLARRPLAIGVAGDSGTGKDTLALALSSLFGEGAVTGLSGDDYHLFERKGRLWQALTHLDPRANDLEAFSRDAFSLIEWRSIASRHYDHATGLFTAPRLIQASDVVLISGLHALYAPSLRERLNVSVFLDMDEELRRFFKIRRDVHQRGHPLEKVLSSIERRRADYDAFVRPQRDQADIIFSLMPADPGLLDNLECDEPVPLRLRVTLRNPIGLERLTRLLIALCGAQVDVSRSTDSHAAVLTIDGADITPEEIQFTATQLVPHLEELLARKPGWYPGVTGIMQLLVMQQLASKHQ